MEGYLTEREMKFLFLLGAHRASSGDVLEIGSFKGKSTVILAMASRMAGDGRVFAVDPLTSPSETDPGLGGKESGWEDFRANLKRAGVEDYVEFYRMFSHELAPKWHRRLRLLWIDGDHTYSGTKADFDLFSGHLSEGGIIAFHDVLALANFNGPLRVFMEEVLLSDEFGPCGLCGTIGWAQRVSHKDTAIAYKEYKLGLYGKLSRLMPIVSSGKPVEGMRKQKFKLLISLIPHGEVMPENWAGSLIRG